MRVLKGIFNIFYPPKCLLCNSHLNLHEKLICISCENQLPLTSHSVHLLNPFENKFQGRLFIQSATSLLYFKKNNFTQHLIHNLKYNGMQEIGKYLGKKLGVEMRLSNRFDTIDGIIMVPLDEKKLKQRGFNQLTEFSKQLAIELNVTVFENVLIKKHFTESQTHKNKNERFNSLINLFEVNNSEQIENKHILLVDDVITTGATLEQCAEVLLKVENTRISLATMAYSEN